MAVMFDGRRFKHFGGSREYAAELFLRLGPRNKVGSSSAGSQARATVRAKQGEDKV